MQIISNFSRLIRKRYNCFSHVGIRMCSGLNMKFLSQTEAINVDKELFDDYRFSVDQLMELAGLACAHAIAKCFPADCNKNVLCVIGPGNNGGDGLVCARHLALMHFKPTVYYPKPTPKTLYQNLTHQCEAMNIKVIQNAADMDADQMKYDVVVDALFGFSYKPPVREEMKHALCLLQTTEAAIASIDIPSGWDVEQGRTDACDIEPELLISLTAPKKCAQRFQGKFHYLGGRFVPPALAEKYQLKLPDYPDSDLVVKL